MLEKPIFRCCICGINTKDNIEIHDSQFVFEGNKNICNECYKDYKAFNDKALYHKIRRKLGLV